MRGDHGRWSPTMTGFAVPCMWSFTTWALVVRLRINYWRDGWGLISCTTSEIDQMHLSGEGLRIGKLVVYSYNPGHDPAQQPYHLVTTTTAMDFQFIETYKADATRCLSEARLTEARFIEASSVISCAWFRALVHPKRAQDSLRHERLHSCLTEAWT